MKTSTSFSPKTITTAVLLLSSSVTFAASCCGGGSAGSLILPKFGKKVVDVSFDMEHYQGKWDANRKYIADPSADDLNQYRLNLGYGQRLASNWQAGIVVPYVWNDNQFSGQTTQSEGLGDASVSFWYEAFDRVTCVYQVNSIEDLKPAMYFGGSLTIPTGKSAYGDHVTDDYEITGRGFYRFDANFVIEKTIYPFTATVQGSYGNRKSLSAAVGYTVFLEDLDTITVTTAFAKLSEDEGRGAGTNSLAIEKQSTALTAAYASPDLTRVFKISWSHALATDGRGKNFPVTDIITLGFSYAFN